MDSASSAAAAPVVDATTTVASPTTSVLPDDYCYRNAGISAESTEHLAKLPENIKEKLAEFGEEFGAVEGDDLLHWASSLHFSLQQAQADVEAGLDNEEALDREYWEKVALSEKYQEELRLEREAIDAEVAAEKAAAEAAEKEDKSAIIAALIEEEERRRKLEEKEDA